MRICLKPVLMVMLMMIGKERHRMIEFILDGFHSPRSTYLHRPNRQVKWRRIRNHYLWIVQVFDSDTNLRNVVLLLDDYPGR